METVLAGQYIFFPEQGFSNAFSLPPTRKHTHPCCVLSQVAASILHGVGVPQLLKELYLFDNILPFLQQEQRENVAIIQDRFGSFMQLLKRYETKIWSSVLLNCIVACKCNVP